ncbi:response regulator [Spirosoma endophyticum]|uniref:CheY chemotaxis protein or a CheY-like REC (Receiver) domain n=1 Tax=Spirosoma endophyticum TaxID=662367 RepID=A0A1I2ID84_9BACT|nr:response regulator [Spirosoma endophyticum]SFF39608.1 CheY chemotaxis protein or a CheY-like REC (receiver) domain [Spirosoma endophyticum]
MNYSILVVDDDEDDFVLLAAKIKRCQLDVTLTHASSGEAAKRQLQEGFQPHLILVDAQMPRMNGYELLNWIMDSDPWRHIPVVIWTGAISEQEVRRYYQAGANSLLLKQDALQDAETFCRHWFQLVLLPQSVLSGPP